MMTIRSLSSEQIWQQHIENALAVMAEDKTMDVGRRRFKLFVRRTHPERRGELIDTWIAAKNEAVWTDGKTAPPYRRIVARTLRLALEEQRASLLREADQAELCPRFWSARAEAGPLGGFRSSDK